MKKSIFALVLMLLGFNALLAQENDAIYCWVEGASTCYRLSSMPKITYADNSAVLTLAGEASPALVVPLTDGGKLKVVFGIYQETPTSVDAILSPISTDGKYIHSGQLIIVKDGKQYDIHGRIIND